MYHPHQPFPILCYCRPGNQIFEHELSLNEIRLITFKNYVMLYSLIEVHVLNICGLMIGSIYCP